MQSVIKEYCTATVGLQKAPAIAVGSYTSYTQLAAVERPAITVFTRRQGLIQRAVRQMRHFIVARWMLSRLMSCSLDSQWPATEGPRFAGPFLVVVPDRT